MSNKKCCKVKFIFNTSQVTHPNFSMIDINKMIAFDQKVSFCRNLCSYARAHSKSIEGQAAYAIANDLFKCNHERWVKERNE